MPRYPTLLVVLVCAVGCSGRTAPVTVIGPARQDTLPLPTPMPAPPVASRDTGTVAPSATLARTPTPHTDSLPIDSLAERRLAADSAADQAVLDELAAARPVGRGDSDRESEMPSGGPKPLSNAATWDIDVSSFSDHDRVQYYLDFFGTKGRERMSIWLNRMPRYEAMIRERLQKEGLPADLTYLALIESGFSNSATSRAKAVGMWQFMKGTAKLYGLRVDSWVDERRDPYRATDAAARHLRDLTDRFGSVYLAAAAYNAGAGRVSRGLGRLPDDDEEANPLTSDATFFRLYDTKLLRQETKDYVPKLIAAALIAKEPARYGFTVTPETAATYDSIVVPDMTGLDVIARLADTTLTAIRELNPQYLRLATPPGARSVVRLPVGRGESTERLYAALPPRQRVTVVEHLVRRGETLSGIARRYGVRVAELTDANPKLGHRRLRAGQVLIVPTGAVAPRSVASASSPTPRPRVATASKRVAAPQRATASAWHRVRRGETLSGIADEYGVTVRELRSWNGLGARAKLVAGRRLRIAAPPSRADQQKGKKKGPAA